MTKSPETVPCVRIVPIDAERVGQRIDNFLFGLLKGVPKSHVYRLLRSGQVRINGKRAKPESRLAEGDQVRVPPVRVAEPRDPGVAPTGMLNRIDSWIIFEDRGFLVINKPSGVATHGGSGVNFGAIELMRQWRPDQPMELVHRLDRDTSGVLVLAKKRSALTGLQQLIREGRTDKRYLALLSGVLTRGKVDVNAPLAKNLMQGGERMVRVDPEGKPSRSVFRVIEKFADATLCEVELDTGRTHQIRVHAAHIGHPLLGDDKYGIPQANRIARQIGLKRLFLHAAQFSFELEGVDEPYIFHAPLAPELVDYLDRLR
ncbi:MAG: RluA family pseudouridine synthase [Pseudomonadota bacterium]|nr:RluA family pseudouridine synthase [Pseudomonadota bacterium]